MQKWLLDQGPKQRFIKRVSDGQCIDIDGYSTADEAKLQTWDCHPEDTDPAHQNQDWKLEPGGTIVAMLSKKCMDRSGYGTTPGTQVWLFSCTNAFNQVWYYNQTDQTIRAKDSQLCLDTEYDSGPSACESDPGMSMPFCDYSLPISERVKNLVSNLTQQEKYTLFNTDAGSVPRLNIRKYQWWSEALHGVGGSPGVRFVNPTPYATSFPQVILTSASFNATLFKLIGQTISTEARAFNNVGNAGLTFWAPNINIIRDPRWGRGHETPGEDPYLTSVYASNFVPGMQEGEDASHLKVSSCCKHFAAYDLEDWNGVDRHHFNAIVTDQDMADTFLAPFQACVERGKASSLMCSYNRINGVPACADSNLMTTKARGLWGFNGYITSDCGAVSDIQYTHKYTTNADQTCKVTLEAGMDIGCDGFIPPALGHAIDSGAVSQNTVDQALTNLFSVQMRLGIFDPADKQPYKQYNYTDKVNTKEHQKLALEAAQQGLVLLKNTGNVLPLSAAAIKSVALIGPHADATRAMQGNYEGNAPYLISPLAGVKSYVPGTNYEPGCAIANNDRTGFGKATAAAKLADVTVLVVGIDQSQESEGRDRTIVSLPGVQNDLITAVAAAAKGPVIVVVMAGGSVDMSVAKNTPNVAAILWVGYPGQSGGQAIADVLFGTVNPSGRMPYTVYPANLTSSVSMFDMNMRPGPSNPGRTYRFYTGAPIYQFGDGLSYTSFKFQSALIGTRGAASTIVDKKVISNYAKIIKDDSYLPVLESHPAYTIISTISTTVTNNGTRDGAVSVLAYSVPPTPGQGGNPIKSLFAFEKIFLKRGESKTVNFPVTAHHLTVAGVDGTRQVLEGEWSVLTGDNISPSKISFTVQ